MLTILLIVLAMLPDERNLYQVSWYYPYNDSKQRIYHCDGCSFYSIAESGNEYPEYLNTSERLVYDVILHGDVDEGEITIAPLRPCWILTLRSDYTLLKRTWQDQTCQHVFLPTISN